MSALGVQIVREYFELNGFLVRHLRAERGLPKAQSSKKPDDAGNLLVVNSASAAPVHKAGFILFSSNLSHLSKAYVFSNERHMVHYPQSAYKNGASIYKFIEKHVCKELKESFHPLSDLCVEFDTYTKILVLPGLPTQDPYKSQSIALLQKHGIDAVLFFRAILQGVIDKIDLNHSHYNNDMLESLRILAKYDMIKPPQMELFKR